MDNTSNLIQNTRAEIQSISSIPSGDPAASQNIQKGLARSLVNAAKEYQSVQQTAKAAYRENLKRQYKIAKPDATDAEIEDAIEKGQSSNGGLSSVFQQELLSSRVGDQRRMLQDVQNRQNDLERIEKSIIELFNLMQDMQMLLEVRRGGEIFYFFSSSHPPLIPLRPLHRLNRYRSITLKLMSTAQSLMYKTVPTS